MSNVTVTNSEYADLIMILLYDAIREGSPLEENYRFKEFVDLLKSRNAKPQLFNHYLDMDAHTRVLGKRVKKSLVSSDTARVTIQGKTKEEVKSIKKTLKQLVGLSEQIDATFDRDLCKLVFRKVKDYRYKTAKPVTEEVLDKIIDKCIEKYAERNQITEENDNG